MEPSIIAEELFFQGDEYFASLLNDLNAAEESIDIETYTFLNDETGKRILTVLKEKALSGLRVRLLVDGIGSWQMSSGFLEGARRAGIKIKVYHPIPWQFWHWQKWKSFGDIETRILNGFRYINRRNHRKTCLIDRKIIWIGSFNISQIHKSKREGGQGWRDSGVRVQIDHAEMLEDSFNKAFFNVLTKVKKFKISPRVTGEEKFRINNTLRKRRVYYKNLIRRIQRSENRIWVTNAYFLPRIRLLKALKVAASKKVDVRLLLPSRSDVFIFPLIQKLFYEELLRSGVKIYEYVPGVLHAKSLICDSWMTLGSSNLNFRSFLHDLEIEYVVSFNETKERLVKQFENDMNRSLEVRGLFKNTNIFLRFLARLSLLLKNWL